MSGLILSQDDGSTWTEVNIPSRAPSVFDGFVGFNDSLIYISGVRPASGSMLGLRSSDGGASWSNGSIATECWQPAFDGRYAYSVLDFGTVVFRSADSARSWTRVSGVGGHFTGCVQTDSVYIAAQQDGRTPNGNGFVLSTDSGVTWTQICGPANLLDTRFSIFGHKIFAFDETGDLWNFELRKSQRLAVDPVVYVDRKCDSAIGRLHLSSTCGCSEDFVLDSVSFPTGVSGYRVDWPTRLRNGLSGPDSISIRYNGRSYSDTSAVTLHYKLRGIPHDTTVLVILRGAPTVKFLSISNRLQTKGCAQASGEISFAYEDECFGKITFDSATISGSSNFVLDPSSLNGSHAILYYYSANHASHDTATLVLHFHTGSSSFDSVVTLTAYSDGNGPSISTGLVSSNGSRQARMDAIQNFVSLLARTNVPRALRLTGLSCIVRCTSDAISKSGPCTGMNGWQVTNEVMNGSELHLEVSRQTSIDLHAGDEIVRIPIRANVALDTEGVIVLKDYSFNADFAGCRPESITPDTVRVIVTPECGDSTIRHFMRSGVPFAVSSIRPNPARDELHVDLERAATSVVVSYEVFDALGETVLAGPNLPGTLDAGGLRAGVYYLRLASVGYVVTKRFAIER